MMHALIKTWKLSKVNPIDKMANLLIKVGLYGKL